MRSLLDVNVLLALFDASHEHHDVSRRWLEDSIEHGWASCAITQIGFVRVISQPAYPGAIATGEAIGRLAGATGTVHHEYWASTVSLCDATRIRRSRVTGHRQVADAWLLALAVAHGGRFVTLDRRISLACVHQAKAEHLLVL